jgi:hypothetical protein
MSFDHFLHWLADTQFSSVMRDSLWAEPLFETIHVLTLTVFLGFTLFLDLRMLDVVMRGKPIGRMFEQMNPYLFGGFIVMIVTGILLFSADPVSFWATIFFKLKMIMLALALVNVLVFNYTLGKRMGEWDGKPSTPTGVKVTGLVSMILWICVVAAGRGIAYALPPP